MTYEDVASALLIAERNFRTAQLELDGSVQSSVKYRNAHARYLQLERIAQLLIQEAAEHNTCR